MEDFLSGTATATARARETEESEGNDGGATAKRAVAPAVETDPTSPILFQGQIARLAYSYWEARGRSDGSAEEDWFRAERELRSQQV